MKRFGAALLPKLRSVSGKRFTWGETSLLEKFERLIGLHSVHDSYRKVADAEKAFLKSSEIRRNVETQLQSSQDRLRDLNSEKGNLSRYDDRYLKLFMEEHNLMKQIDQLNVALENAITVENDDFSTLARELRNSHEQEMVSLRANNRLLFFGSSFCVLIGFISTLAFHYYRLSRLKTLVISTLSLKKASFPLIKEKSEEAVPIENTNEFEPLYAIDAVRKYFGMDWESFLRVELNAALCISLSSAVLAVFLYSY